MAKLKNQQKNKNSLQEDKNTTDWFDKNKFKEILAIIGSNKFNYRNKQVNSSILALETLLILLEIIQLVKYLLKKV